MISRDRNAGYAVRRCSDRIDPRRCDKLPKCVVTAGAVTWKRQVRPSPLLKSHEKYKQLTDVIYDRILGSVDN